MKYKKTYSGQGWDVRELHKRCSAAGHGLLSTEQPSTRFSSVINKLSNSSLARNFYEMVDTARHTEHPDSALNFLTVKAFLSLWLSYSDEERMIDGLRYRSLILGTTLKSLTQILSHFFLS
jgi:hypothetical protein